eukprot:403337179
MKKLSQKALQQGKCKTQYQEMIINMLRLQLKNQDFKKQLDNQLQAKRVSSYLVKRSQKK